jgi:tetratricopeptide (TPR) repeat protein
MKHIVFLGNCQARRLYVFYNEHFARITGDTTGLVANFEVLTPQVREALARADVIVSQVTDVDQKVSLDKVETRAKIIEYPYVTGNFLWPYSGKAHIYNTPLPHMHDGPYGVQYGNPWLNARIKKGALPDDIVAEYEALDMSKAVNLDRTYELSMDRARDRDRKSGSAVAALIEKSLTDIPLFMTPANLEFPLFEALARGVYEQLGLPSGSIDHALGTLWKTPFPIADHPIHPSVARHFGLKFIGPDTLYRTFTGERLTFREWITRYVNYQWNDALLEGNHRCGQIRQFDAEAQSVLEQLEQGLAQSSGSALAESNRAYLLKLKGDHTGAMAATRRAAALDPAQPQIMGTLAFYSADEGNYDEAERLTALMTTTWPRYADGWNRYGSILVRRGKSAEAVRAVTRAVEIDPGSAEYRKHLASVLAHDGQQDRAREALTSAIALMPGRADLYIDLSRLVLKSGDLDAALIAARRATEAESGNAAAHGHLADVLIRRGDPVAASNVLRNAIANAAAPAGLLVRLADLLTQGGRHDEAAAELRKAVALDPDNAHLRYSLAQNLIKGAALADAEAVLTEALARDPFNDGLHAVLANMLAQQGRGDDAEASLRRAIELKPGQASLHQILAELYNSMGNFQASEAAYRTAIELSPGQIDWRGSLALIVNKQGRIDDSLDVIEEAVALAPRNPHLLSKYSHLLKEKGLLARARKIAQEAIALAPTLAGLHAAFADVCVRDGDIVSALDAYRTAIRLAPGNDHFKLQFERLDQRARALHQAHAAE